MQNAIRIERNVPMKMRDGAILRADVHRPDDNGKYPAILVRTPYNKSLSGYSDFMNVIDMTFAGYAVVLQDIRGRFASEGEWGQTDRFPVEGPDGYDSVEWIASQPWCDGNVGLAGVSYMAVLAWVAAMEKPPHLKAMAPWMAGTAPMVEGSLLDGVMLLHLWARWTPMMAVDVADRLEREGKDVSRMRMMLFQAIFNPSEVTNYLPLKNIPHFQFEGVKEIWESRLKTSVPPPEMAGKLEWRYDSVTVPCLHVSGWYDIYTRSAFANFLNMKQKGGSEVARRGQHVIMGPWAHGAALPDIIGEFHFGPSAREPGAQLTNQHLAFFNKYLKGIDSLVPPVRYFVMGLNRWRNADTWPIPGTEWQRMHLHSRGKANSSTGDGWLSQDTPGVETPDTFIYDPLSPVPTRGGRVVAETGVIAGPLDQSDVESRDDVLCYTTLELTKDMEVTGPVKLHLFASTSAVDTDFTACLVDVFPNGHAYNIADGIIRARYRKSIFQPELVKPGEVDEYTIDLGNTSYFFRKGHRVRVHISSSNFPAYDRNMNTGNPTGEDKEGIKAVQKIYHGRDSSSYIDLPVVPR